MTKPNLLSICLLAMLLAPLAGCQILSRHGEEQARDNEAQVREREVQTQENKAPTREREAQASERKVQARAREVPARERKASQRDSEIQVQVSKVQVPDRENEAGVGFSDADVTYIRNFYKQGHQPGLTVGRIMKPRLGETYPFGYTWRPLPSELEARLSPLPKGYIRILVGTDIGILEINTRVVVDLLENLAG